MTKPLDCLVIGGGPAGLTAAIYLARYLLDVAVVDGGHSRAALIPRTHNHAGYPEGIAGPDLLERMRRQAGLYGAEVMQDHVGELAIADGMFAATIAGGTLRARSVLLATGVINNRPDMPDALHAAALQAGRLRYCPVCDGYEVTDRRVGVIGTGERGTNEALFLRGFTRDVTLIAPDGAHELADAQRDQLGTAGVAMVDGPARDFAIEGETISVGTATDRLEFFSIYPALGSAVRSELAVAVGADTTAVGCLTVDDHQRTSVVGLYAAGDVVQGLDQISHAMGEGGVAATTIRNDLASQQPIRR